MSVLTWCRLSLFTPGETPGSQEHANKSRNCLRFELSKVECFFTAARSETSPPRVWQSVRLWAPPTCPGTKNTSEKTCKQSAIIMCTLNGDMINLISGRPANNARKCLVTFFFLSPKQSTCSCIGDSDKSLIQFAKFIMLQRRYLTLMRGDYCCSDFSVSFVHLKLDLCASSQSWI